MRGRRIALLTSLFVGAACAAQVAAPRSTPSPSSALSGVPDSVYLREAGNGSMRSYIARIDVASGLVSGGLPDGVLTPDRGTLYSIESVDGATRTRIHEIDVASGRERRAFTIDGDWIAASSNDDLFGVSADGTSLVLASRAAKVDGSWVGGFAVVDLRSGAVRATAELKGSSNELLTGVAPRADAVVLTEAGNGRARVRIWDLAGRAFVPDAEAAVAGWDGVQLGFMTAPLPSPDGGRLYLLDAGDAHAGPFLRVVDFATKQLSSVALPERPRTTDNEKSLLWTLALSKDGSTVYATNAALGYVDEVDARSLALRRSATFAVSSVENGALARLRQALFPVADAKRFIRGGAVVSTDGRTLYVPGTKGIAVIDLATLRLAGVWVKSGVFDGMALSPDGTTLYAIDDQAQSGEVDAIRTRDGTALGAIHADRYLI